MRWAIGASRFQYGPAYFGDSAPFPARAAIAGSPYVSWEELAVALAGQALDAVHPTSRATFDAESRVTRVIRLLDAEPRGQTSLGRLAGEANLSAYHFLRVFQSVAGVTPHQYVLRMRLREAAVRLATQPAKVIDIALGSGFRDVSNFNRTFRAEFGVSPRAYRRQYA